jgi:glycosyltransferase involved in cell wall biosynthesis
MSSRISPGDRFGPGNKNVNEMKASKPKTAILHYSAPPVVGGVEAVIEAHVRLMIENGFPVTVIAGKGEQRALPEGCGFKLIPEMDSLNRKILAASEILESGQAPADFSALAGGLEEQLGPELAAFDNVIIHNILTKHFNLPLTAALFRLMDSGRIGNVIAWSHDFTWTSPNSSHKVHPGYPWDLLRTYRPDVRNVTISQKRQAELAGLYQCDPQAIQVVYNGINVADLLGLSAEGWELVQRLDLLSADLFLLMPVRVTQAKNIEYALKVVSGLKSLGAQVKLVLTGPPDPHDENSMRYFRSLQALRGQLGVEAEMRFVFESGPEPGQGYLIGLDVVGDLYRVADVLFMPSHREGFGMPIVEAGFMGLAIVASTAVPAAEEIADEAAMHIDLADPAEDVACRIWRMAQTDARLTLRRRIRQQLTWQAIFNQQIKPMLYGPGDDDSAT